MSLRPGQSAPPRPDESAAVVSIARAAPRLAGLEPASSAGEIAPELWAGLHLPGLEREEKLRELATAMQGFTPRVSLEPPDGLLLEVRGSLHLFQGVDGMRAAVLSGAVMLYRFPDQIFIHRAEDFIGEIEGADLLPCQIVYVDSCHIASRCSVLATKLSSPLALPPSTDRP